MAHPLTSSAFRKLLDSRLTEVFEEDAKKAELASMIPRLFNEATSDSAWEEFFYVTGAPDVPEFHGKLAYLPIYPGWHKKIEHKEYAAGIAAERKLFDDNMYGVLEDNASKLARSSMRVREKKGARAFQYAFSTAFDYMTSEEGVALCSTSHTVKTGVSTTSGFNNLSTTALSKTAVATARIKMRQMKTDIGERFERGENWGLIVPDNLAETAFEIAMTPKSLDTGDGNVSFHYQRYEIIVYPRLDDVDSNNWFLIDLDNIKDSLIFYDRIRPDYENTVDFDTKQLLQSVYFRLSYGWKDWRWIDGSQVS